MLLDPKDQTKFQKYQDYLLQAPQATFYQLPAWAKVKAGWESHLFLQEEGGEVVSSIQVLSVKNAAAGKKMFYAPRGPVCDLSLLSRVQDLLEEVVDFAKAQDAFLLRVDPARPYDPSLAKAYLEAGFPLTYKMSSYVQWPMSMALEIGGRDFDQVLQSFTKSTRKEVRRSYRQGFSLRLGSREDVPTFYRITQEMSERKGINHRPLDYYYRLYDAFSDRLRMSFVSLEGKDLACSLLLSFNGWATALYGADTLEVDLGQSYFLDMEEIRYCTEQKLAYYDLGGIRSLHPQNGLYRFKRKLTNDQVIFWLGNFEYVLDQAAYDRFLLGKDETDYTPPELLDYFQ